MEEGAARVEGVEVMLRATKDVSAEEILAADGLLVGTPVQWAGPAAEAKRFVDRVAEVLREAKGLEREGRTAGVFVTGGAPAAGKDLARLSLLAALLHMRFAAVGGIDAEGFGTLGAQATTGLLDPGLSPEELGEARATGERFARWTRAVRSAFR
jgi:NAD(P)H dehydrogenase (quinone)